jgi:hypothetical protein
MQWLGNETFYTESDDYGNITWPYYTIQYTYTNLLEGGAFTTIFHNDVPLYYFTIHEDSSEIEFNNSIWKKVNLTANNKVLINATDGLKYYLNDELIFNESIDMPTDGKVDFQATTLPSVNNLVVYKDSQIEITKAQYIREYDIDNSVILKKVEELREDIHLLRHEINISDNIGSNLTKDYTELDVLSGVVSTGNYQSQSYIQNSTAEPLSWKNYTMRMDFQPYAQYHTFLLSIDGLMILFHNSNVYLYDKSDFRKIESPVVDGPNQLTLNAQDNNITISVNDVDLFQIKKPINFTNISIYSKKTVMAFGNIILTKKGCSKQNCRRVYVVDSERPITSRRDLKATADPELISTGLEVNPLLGIAAIFQGYYPLNTTNDYYLNDTFIDYDIELDPSLINEDIPSEEYLFDGQNAQVRNMLNYSFSYTFSLLEGAGLLETSFNSPEKIVSLIVSQSDNRSYLFTNTDGLVRRTAQVNINPETRHRIDVVYENGKSNFYIDGRKIFENIAIDLSNGFFSISALNTHFSIMNINLLDRSTKVNVPFSIDADPCRLRKIKEISLDNSYLYLDVDEKATFSKQFLIDEDFDFGKVSVVMPDKEIHFWVINND